MPYNNDPGSPFESPDFTVGLPPVRDWPRHAGKSPWILDPEDHPKPTRTVPAESTGTNSMDEGRRKKKKKKKHHRSKKFEKPELKVTTCWNTAMLGCVFGMCLLLESSQRLYKWSGSW